MTKPAKPHPLNRPLYEIAAEYTNLLDELERLAVENDGILPDDLATSFNRLEGEVRVKLENCCVVDHALEIQAKALKEEEARLRERRKKVEESQARLRDYIGKNMKRMGLDRSEGLMLNVRLQENPPSVLVEDVAKVPDEYVVYKVTMPAKDMTAIGEMLEFCVEHGAFVSNPLSAWESERVVRLKPILDDWKKASGALEVPGVTITQNESVRIWS